MGKGYLAKEGDCVSSIAFERGLFWKTVWDDPQNADLKSRRRDPNVLKPGDIVHIPVLRLGSQSGATESRHRFVLKGVPAKLQLRIVHEPLPEPRPAAGEPPHPPRLDAKDSFTEDAEPVSTRQLDEPRANVPYVLEIDGVLNEGTTDADGRVEVTIPPNARRGKLILEPGTASEKTLPLRLGHLDPLSELTGVKQRLANLGFDCGDCSAADTPALPAALRAFQEKQGLPITGEVDQATRDKLRELHGS